MIKNFFLIALRNIVRHKVFTFINVFGLAIGIAASLLILLWVQDELSFDTFNKNAETIYRVEEDQFYSGKCYHVTVTPYPSGPVWKEKIPEIKEQVRLNLWLPRILFRSGDKVFFENSIIAADSSLMKVFSLRLVAGDPETAMNSPHSIVFTETLAKKYFGKENPIGKSVTLENKFEFMVTGVMKDPPKNSLFSFAGIIPYSFLKETGAVYNSWDSNSIFTYLLLEKDADIEAVNNKLTGVVKEYLPETTTKYMVFPLLDIHLHGQFGFDKNNGPVIAVYIFTLIAIFVLLIACINFINLSTAKAALRGKEIGIKKVSGAGQPAMILQFMLESMLLVFVALIFALILVGLSLDIFNNVSGKSFMLSDLFQTKFLLSLAAVGLLATLVSGFYPAFYMSSFNPVAVLKGETSGTGKNSRLKQILVVVQFALSILIATASVFMYLQLKFLQEKELGYDKKDLISIPMAENMKPKYYLLKRELQKEDLIQSVTASGHNPVMMGSNSGGARWEGKDPDQNILIGTNGIDYDYLKTMKMEIVSGRDFSRDFADQIHDTTGNFLVNEEVVKAMNIGDPVGKGFHFMGLNGRIVGVMKNFHFRGAYQRIEPIAFALVDTNHLNMILIRLTPGQVPASLESVKKVWNQILPEYPLDYSFVDQEYSNLYKPQMRLTSLLGYFTVLAVILACLGLYGLSSYSAERRYNEIGIRKVMGAGSLTIMYALSKEFLALVFISIAIAIPAGIFIVKKLLSEFAYRIDMNILVFAAIAMGAIIIAIITISFHAYRATTVNPAEALKVE
jgi:ABC-type antimicrobial peptide transport system permease subunit